MKLEFIIQSEVSQKEKHQYSLLTHIYMVFRKMVTITLYARQQKRHRCMNSLLDSVGEGEGGMIWENSIETCISSYVKQIASPGSMSEIGCSGLVHWDDPEGWDEERWGGRWAGVSGWGTHVHPWVIHVNVWQKPLQYCKVNSLQLK